MHRRVTENLLLTNLNVVFVSMYICKMPDVHSEHKLTKHKTEIKRKQNSRRRRKYSTERWIILAQTARHILGTWCVCVTQYFFL